MARESQTSDTAVGQPLERIQKPIATQDIRSIIRSRSSALWNWIKQISIIIWSFLYNRIILPSTVVILGLYSAIEKAYTLRKHHIMCDCHQMMASIAKIKGRRLTGIVMLTSLVMILFSTAFYSFGIEIIVDGESLGYVINQADYQESVNRVQSRVSKILGKPYSVNPKVTFSFGVVERDNLLQGEKLENLLFSQIEGIEELYVLSVDGKIIGACQDRTVIDNALSSLTKSNDSHVTKKIMSNIAITHEIVDSSYLRSEDEMKSLLSSTKTIQQPHVVQTGENIDSICTSYHMKKSEFMALNPGIDPYWIIPGQEVIVNQTIPLVSVEQVKRITEIRDIPFTQTEIKDSSLYVGKKSIKTNGVAGSKQIVSDITYVNGKENKRTVVSETVLKQPVNEIILVGTKPIPKKAATGTFRRPTGASVISSNYGYRRSGFHTGVDFALAHGSPVYASDGGTVSYSGWKGGYGYLVIISHGNGLQTYYGHNSKLLVSSGDKVAKGEQIAKIGSTGNSTGPHCHFEVRVNGRHVNPWRYIS